MFGLINPLPLPSSCGDAPDAIALRRLRFGVNLVQETARIVYHVAWAVFCFGQEMLSSPNGPTQAYWKFHARHYLVQAANDFLLIESAWKSLLAGEDRSPAGGWDHLRGRLLAFGHFWFG